jgi:aryl-alcohol dehydrogenase-like predicted oxidoreductase
MERRSFGNSGVSVSAISLGCWIFGVDWWGHYTDADANRLCSFAHDQGITFFDNGDAYGNGRAETLFGNWLKQSGIPRDRVEIGGKFGYDFYSDPGTPGSHKERKQDFSPEFMRTALERSLQRLQTDYIDVYTAHNIKLPQFNDELFAELEKVKDEGKIRCWGVSLGPPKLSRPSTTSSSRTPAGNSAKPPARHAPASWRAFRTTRESSRKR